MEENAAAFHTALNAAQALGRGFDVNYDTRLLYCKGVAGSRVVEIDEDHTRDLSLYDNLVLPNVSRDIKNFQEPGGRDGSSVCNYDEMVEYFNRKASIPGHAPLGSFNVAFSFTGAKHFDATTTKTLCMDGYFIPLARLQLMNSPLVLQESVKRAVPASWDPPALASFIENFGTHIITSVTIGGKDVIYVKQHLSSPLSTMEIKSYVHDIGNQRFSSTENLTSSDCFLLNKVLVFCLLMSSLSTNFPIPFLNLIVQSSDPSIFNSQGIFPQPTNAPYIAGNGKEDVTVIFRRRGGDDLEQSHNQWAKTVRSSPDVIEMSFYPITLLLEGIKGKEHLERAISFYLEYKPQIEELRYFLEFQVPRVWAPVQDRFPGQRRKEPVCLHLQFSMMGQKLYVSQEQVCRFLNLEIEFLSNVNLIYTDGENDKFCPVSVGRKPVTGMRLTLEGSKSNRLCIYLQHLTNLPKILLPCWDTHVAIGAPKWQGPEEQDSRWFEPVKWKNFSHVSTAPIECPETFIGDDHSGVYIVTGAQLGVWDFGSRNVLYMKLLYSRLPGCTIRRSLWDHTPNDKSNKKVNCENNIGDASSVIGENIIGNKLAKFVDMTEMSKGPQDPPGHWLVTGGKLGVEKGRIVLRLKYSLLNY
ncbi:hypothetical protein H5410_053331 [Solanum commersonii]|uniref:MACPF domain-containing protein n=1 Tax=Solanum commersonii TaxID=4109 RepID=A0A9J5X6S8_SOLCO|nr:hypothetical protein H5410_053331 [Solanum commersonii]